MSRLLKAQVTLKAKSGIPEDHVTNSFWFLRNIEDATKDDEVAQNLKDFYDLALPVAAQRLSAWLSPALALTGHEIKTYNMADPTPRAPTHSTTFSLTATAATAYPKECSVVLSARAEKVSGTVDARRRGRIYFGPVGATTGTLDATTGALRPITALRNALLEAAARLAADCNSDGWLWGVHSQTAGGQAFVPYREWWVDDAFDTQRRRGERPTTKVTTTVTQIALAV